MNNYTVIYNFNSSMVQLKVTRVRIYSLHKLNFNSSMVQLKVKHDHDSFKR